MKRQAWLLRINFDQHLSKKFSEDKKIGPLITEIILSLLFPSRIKASYFKLFSKELSIFFPISARPFHQLAVLSDLQKMKEGKGGLGKTWSEGFKEVQ